MTKSICFLLVAVMAIVFPQQAKGFEASDFLVEGLEEYEQSFSSYNGTMYAGLLPIDKVDGSNSEPRGKLSFWLFEPEETKDSLTIWLNGGPGCSSYGAGLVLECGPVTFPHHPAGHGRTKADQPLLPNDYSWTKATNLLFIEQPTGVGFSYGPEVHSEADLSRDFYHFLVNFMETFPEMANKKLYIVGESYAGMYVPSIAHYIQQQNNKKHAKSKIRLSGIALGNGWVDAVTQGPAVIDYAYWHGMIDTNTRDGLWKVWHKCERKQHLSQPFHDFTTTDECAIVEAVLEAAGGSVFPASDLYGPNQYDVTTWDNYPIINVPVTAATQFFNNPEVQKALHFDHRVDNWVPCIPGAGRRRLDELLPGEKLLRHDQPESVSPYIAELLDDDIRVVVYGGDRDLSVNLQGSEQVLNEMEWHGQNEWKNSDRYLWMVDGDVAGYVKTHKNLDMLLVLNSGHLVPYNVPIPALDLITRLVNEEAFGDILLPKLDFGDNEETEIEALEANPPIFSALLAIGCFLIGTFVGSYRKESPYRKLP